MIDLLSIKVDICQSAHVHTPQLNSVELIPTERAYVPVSESKSAELKYPSFAARPIDVYMYARAICIFARQPSLRVALHVHVEVHS